jgi:hypothetical protein
MITTEQLNAKYGLPNQTGKNYLTTIKLPFKMRVAWSRHEYISSFQCHKLIAAPLLSVFNDLLNHYDYAKLVELGIDLYGGCFNYRLMRDSNHTLSVHSWGVAIDLDPDRNLLKENHKTARFARPEYKPMIDIFYKHGFEGLGPEKDYDWMHFQIKN